MLPSGFAADKTRPQTPSRQRSVTRARFLMAFCKIEGIFPLPVLCDPAFVSGGAQAEPRRPCFWRGAVIDGVWVMKRSIALTSLASLTALALPSMANANTTGVVETKPQASQASSAAPAAVGSVALAGAAFIGFLPRRKPKSDPHAEFYSSRLISETEGLFDAD